MNVTNSLFLCVELNAENTIPQRIQLLPAGAFVQGKDNRMWGNPNPQAVVDASNAYLKNHPIDENHAIDLQAPQGKESPAFGWFSNVTLEPSGEIWADVEWNEDGIKALTKKQYRYFSPAFSKNDNNEITAILRGALTNAPNLDITALNAEQNAEQAKETNMKGLLAAMGLAETATEAEAIAKFTELNASKSAVDLSVYAKRDELNSALERAVTAEKQVAELNAQALKQEAEVALNSALEAQKITPATKEGYAVLCSTKEGLEQFKKIMEVTPSLDLNSQQAPAGSPEGPGSVALNAEEKAVCKAMGMSEADFAKQKAEDK